MDCQIYDYQISTLTSGSHNIMKIPVMLKFQNHSLGVYRLYNTVRKKIDYISENKSHA